MFITFCKTIVIIYKQEYDEYIKTFISHNNFELLNKDPTNIYQKCIKDSVNSCKALIPSKQKYKYYINNPKPPTILALINYIKIQSPLDQQ
jgi:hypothetical protein